MFFDERMHPERAVEALCRLAHGGASPPNLQGELDILRRVWDPHSHQTRRRIEPATIQVPDARAVWLVSQRAGQGALEDRLRALGALRFAGRHAAVAYPVLLRALGDTEPRLRLAAARTLTRLPASPALVPALRGALEDVIWSVRWCAAQVLLRAGQGEGIEAVLLASAPRPVPSPQVWGWPEWLGAVWMLSSRSTDLQILLERLQPEWYHPPTGGGR